MAISRQFDPLFAKYRGALPVPFLRALSKKESNQNPGNTGGSYWGLLQVGYNKVLPEFNQRYGTHYTREDLLDPEVNVRIASDLLNHIIGSYAEHPSPNLRPNFSNPEFVKLLLAGWNSGYSKKSGVGRVASYLEGRGIPVTHNNVFKYARAAGATKYLQPEFDKKRHWQKSVADLYYAQPDTGAPFRLRHRKPVSVASVGVIGFVLWGIWRLLEGN